MKTKNIRKIVLILFTIFILAVAFFYIFFKNNEAIALSKYGSRGSEVTQIQTKLKRWGYYNGNIDGIFGSQTLEAVKYFQRKNGLTVDGIAGPATLKAMGIYSSNSSSSGTSSTNSNDLNLLARVVYQSGAYDAVTDGQINLSPDSTAKKAAQDALNGWDPSYGAIYYFNPKTATNKWIWSRPVTVTIGNHRFCK